MQTTARSSGRAATRRTWALFCDVTAACCILLVGVALIGFLASFFRPGALYNYDRFCLDINRHRVRPFVPAIEGDDGGPFEPLAWGWLAVDVSNGEVSWRLEDSLGVEPFRMSIRDSATGEMVLRLGTNRDQRGRFFAGVVTTSATTARYIMMNPSQFYVSVDERTSNGSVRELARDYLTRLCARDRE